MEEKTMEEKVTLGDFLKALQTKLFMDEMETIVKMAKEKMEHANAASVLTDCSMERFSEILVDVLFHDKPLEGFTDELGIEIPKKEEEEE